jgi:hypothetical protein
VKKFEFRDITVEEVHDECVEAIVLGGDKVIPLLEIDNRSIYKGTVG